MHRLQAAFAIVFLASCSASQTADVAESDVREMSKEEALADFEQIVTLFRARYGALERKEERYGFSFETLANDYRQRIKGSATEATYRGLFQEFISRFADAHVSLDYKLISDDSHGFKLPFVAMPIEGTFVIYDVTDSKAGVLVGDELLAIDGVAAGQFVKRVLKYISTPNPEASEHFAATYLTRRSSFMSQGLKDGATATVRVRRTSGTVEDVKMTWQESPHLLPPKKQPVHAVVNDVSAISAPASQVTQMELSKFGTRVPFFMSEAVRSALKVVEVEPSAAALEKVKITAEQAATIDYFAVTYTVGTKKVLFVRIPDFQPADADVALAYLKALFFDHQTASTLVLDETHNPGGSLYFAEGLVALLAKQPFRRPVQHMHADRAWIERYASFADQIRKESPMDAEALVVAQHMEDAARAIDNAYSSAEPLSPPLLFPFAMGQAMRAPDADGWKKPVIVLADELSVSCGDLIPLLIKANGIGKVFGATTMGGGGTVEEVGTLANTNGVLAISRGLLTVYDPTGTYPEELYVEDNGVAPDIPYAHTLADFRAGYVGYVQAFNAALSGL